MTLNHDVAAENETLRKIIRDTLWMACRYAHGRQSYAVAMYNDAAREADKLGVLENRHAKQEPIFAIDGTLTREMSGLTEAEFEVAGHTTSATGGTASTPQTPPT